MIKILSYNLYRAQYVVRRNARRVQWMILVALDILYADWVKESKTVKPPIVVALIQLAS